MTSGRITVVIVKAAGAARDAMVARLHLQSDIIVAATADRAHAGRAFVLSHAPDIVLVNAALGGGDSRELVAAVNAHAPATKIIVTDVTPTRETLVTFLKEGARGFIAKDAPVGEYERAIRAVASGGYVIPPVLKTRWRPREGGLPAPASTLEILSSVHMTSRERDVATLMANGATDDEVSERLGMTQPMLLSHFQNILEKLTLHTRLQIAGHAVRVQSPYVGRSQI